MDDSIKLKLMKNNRKIFVQKRKCIQFVYIFHLYISTVILRIDISIQNWFKSVKYNWFNQKGQSYSIYRIRMYYDIKYCTFTSWNWPWTLTVNLHSQKVCWRHSNIGSIVLSVFTIKLPFILNLCVYTSVSISFSATIGQNSI